MAEKEEIIDLFDDYRFKRGSCVRGPQFRVDAYPNKHLNVWELYGRLVEMVNQRDDFQAITHLGFSNKHIHSCRSLINVYGNSSHGRWEKGIR